MFAGFGRLAIFFVGTFGSGSKQIQAVLTVEGAIRIPKLHYCSQFHCGELTTAAVFCLMRIPKKPFQTIVLTERNGLQVSPSFNLLQPDSICFQLKRGETTTCSNEPPNKKLTDQQKLVGY